jgi:hypothetical protein
MRMLKHTFSSEAVSVSGLLPLTQSSSPGENSYRPAAAQTRHTRLTSGAVPTYVHAVLHAMSILSEEFGPWTPEVYIFVPAIPMYSHLFPAISIYSQIFWSAIRMEIITTKCLTKKSHKNGRSSEKNLLRSVRHPSVIQSLFQWH